MAAQMHFAYSKTIRKGAGIVAGGPVYCSQGNATIALGPCMADTGSRNLPYLISVVNTWSGNGYIDPTANMAASKVYLLSGTIDSTVRQPVMDDLKTMYGNYLPAANIRYKNNLAAEHSMPTDFFGNGCAVNDTPYVNNCNFDTAGEILKWLYGAAEPEEHGHPERQLHQLRPGRFLGQFQSRRSTAWPAAATPMCRPPARRDRLPAARGFPRLHAERFRRRHGVLPERRL